MITEKVAITEGGTSCSIGVNVNKGSAVDVVNPTVASGVGCWFIVIAMSFAVEVNESVFGEGVSKIIGFSAGNFISIHH